MRHPLARALHGIGMDTTDVAARLEVDPKTVARWIDGRVPYPRHRAALVQLTGWTERDLWPAAASPESTDAISEVLVTYPHRSSVPADVWRRLFFGRAHAEIGVLAYSALFLAEDAGVLSLLRQKIEAGTRVRLLLGDPDGALVAARGAEEGVGASWRPASTTPSSSFATWRRPVLSIYDCMTQRSTPRYSALMTS